MKKKFIQIFLISSYFSSFVLNLKFLYINENKSLICSKENCSGNFSNPFNSIINAFTFPFKTKLSDSELIFLLKSDEFSILPNDLNSKIPFAELIKNLTSNIAGINANITILPEKCLIYKNMNKSCPFFSIINIKTENFTFIVPKSLQIINIKFFGNDLSLNYNKTQHEICFNSSKSCCSDKSFKDSSNNCFLSLKKSANNMINSNYGFYTFKNDLSSKLYFENCIFENFYSLNRKTPFFFKSFIYSISKNNMIERKISINNCSFKGSYFQKGILFSIGIKTTIFIENTNASTYNSLNFDETIEKKGDSLIFLDRAIVTIRKCNFIKNYGKRGGVFHFNKFNNITVDNCTFYSNYADYGGSIYIFSTNWFYCYKCRFFSYNDYSKSIHGKIIYVYHFNTLNFNLNVFKLSSGISIFIVITIIL